MAVTATLAATLAAAAALGFGPLTGVVGVVRVAGAVVGAMVALVRWACDRSRQRGAGLAGVALGDVAVAAKLAHVLVLHAWPLSAVTALAVMRGVRVSAR